jgi:hypothetical protein
MVRPPGWGCLSAPLRISSSRAGTVYRVAMGVGFAFGTTSVNARGAFLECTPWQNHPIDAMVGSIEYQEEQPQLRGMMESPPLES